MHDLPPTPAIHSDSPRPPSPPHPPILLHNRNPNPLSPAPNPTTPSQCRPTPTHQPLILALTNILTPTLSLFLIWKQQTVHSRRAETNLARTCSSGRRWSGPVSISMVIWLNTSARAAQFTFSSMKFSSSVSAVASTCTSSVEMPHSVEMTHS